MMTFPPVMERILTKVVITETYCWEFTGYINPSGYGTTTWNGSPRLVHRIVYLHAVGPIPAGLELDHLCRNRKCCNPDHLEPVTRRVNTLRGDMPNILRRRAAAITHCPAGHEYNSTNTYLKKSGGRSCRACQNERVKRKYWDNPEPYRTASRERQAAIRKATTTTRGISA